MDRIDNDSYSMSNLPPETEVVSPQLPEVQRSSEPTALGARLELLPSLMRELGRRLAAASEAREAKIRELQDAIKNETYHVTPEQVADKMLRATLQDDLT
jgi:anti-sigma28 factor (negative regulator of flagellin synthesis)